MKKTWVLGFVAAIALAAGSLTASAQRAGLSIYGPHGSVSVNVGSRGHYGYGGYDRGYYAQRPSNDNRGYGYNSCPPPPPPPPVYYRHGGYDRGCNNGYAYNDYRGRHGYNKGHGYNNGYNGNGYGRGGGYGRCR